MSPRRAWAVLLVPVTLGAQEPVAVKPTQAPLDSILADSSAWVRDTTPPQPNCWRPQRRPPCDSYFLTEIGLEGPIRSRQFGERVTWTFGVMGTHGNSSHGGAFTLYAEPQLDMSIPFSLEWRYRRWLSNSASANAALGYMRTRLIRGAETVPGQGVTAMIGLTANQWIGLTLRGELIRGGGHTARGFMLGATSTRVSEFFIREMALGALRALLGKIGLDLGDDEN